MRNLSGIGVYLLAHLSEYMENIKVGAEVIPGQVVGKTGRSGTYLNRWDTHLHITYYHYEDNKRSSSIFTTTSFIGSSIKEIGINNWEEHEELVATRRDPFNHATTKVANKYK